MALEQVDFVNQESGKKVLTVVHNSDLDTLNNNYYANGLNSSLRGRNVVAQNGSR